MKYSHIVKRASIASLFINTLSLALCAFAGDLNPPATHPNDPAGAMFTLEDLYNRLQSGTTDTIRSGNFVEPTAGPVSGTGRTLNDIMNIAPASDNDNGAAANQVLQGTTYWSLIDANWGPQTGTMPNSTTSFTPGPTDQTIPQGYHDGTGQVTGDADLVATNIAAGVDIFDISGTAPIAVGTALVDQVLADATFSTENGTNLIGTMANIGQQIITPGAVAQTIKQGFHNGSGQVAGDEDLVATNIVDSIEIFGVTGSAPIPAGNATVDQVLAGSTFSTESGTNLIGTMSNVGQQAIMPSGIAQTIIAGFHNGSGQVAGDEDLVATNIVDSIEIFGVTGSAPIPTGNATVDQVLIGSTFSTEAGTSLTGTMANIGQQTIIPGIDAHTIKQGFHNGSGQVIGDDDLVTGNIRSGINLFGVDGDTNVVNTSSGTATAADIADGAVAWVDGVEITGSASLVSVPAPIPQTGQTTSSATGDDGDLQLGVTSPTPRFINNDDGTITDNLTGLVWLEQSNTCSGDLNWEDALRFANGLSSASDNNCGLSDDSVADDWRLPNLRELQSLIDYGNSSPALPDNHPFTGVLSAAVWSSTSFAPSSGFFWSLNFITGSITAGANGSTISAWPVRNRE